MKFITLIKLLGIMKSCLIYFWAVHRPLGSMFAVLWYEMSYENVLRRFGDFCIVVEAVLCTAQRLNINPCSIKNGNLQRPWMASANCKREEGVSNRAQMFHYFMSESIKGGKRFRKFGQMSQSIYLISKGIFFCSTDLFRVLLKYS